MSLRDPFGQRLVIIVLALGFVCYGGLVMVPQVMSGTSFAVLEPYQSTDQALGILGISHPQARLDEVIRTWPANRDILYVAPNKNAFALQVYYVLLGLAYPRHMGAIVCAEGSAPSHLVIENGASTTMPIDDVILLDISPGAAVTGEKRLSPHLTIAPHSGVVNWGSFCPS